MVIARTPCSFHRTALRIQRRRNVCRKCCYRLTQRFWAALWMFWCERGAAFCDVFSSNECIISKNFSDYPWISWNIQRSLGMSLKKNMYLYRQDQLLVLLLKLKIRNEFNSNWKKMCERKASVHFQLSKAPWSSLWRGWESSYKVTCQSLQRIPKKGHYAKSRKST